MVHLLAKCNAVYHNRMYQQSLQKDNCTAQWIQAHERLMQTECPPNWVELPRETEYMRTFLQDRIYMPEIGEQTSNRKRIKHIYNAQLHKYYARLNQLPRVQVKQPQIKWGRVWTNISNKVLPRRVQTT
jgi:hypothetical protein